jgi:hypothetical protein
LLILTSAREKLQQAAIAKPILRRALKKAGTFRNLSGHNLSRIGFLDRRLHSWWMLIFNRISETSLSILRVAIHFAAVRNTFVEVVSFGLRRSLCNASCWIADLSRRESFDTKSFTFLRDFDSYG